MLAVGAKGGRCKMPVYEYFCPHCSRELEVLRPIQSASDYSDCPDCGSKAWRLVSSFGSKTGSYLQPSGEPFRAESEWQASSSEIVATVTKSDVDTRSLADDQQASSAVDMSWLLESQPNGSNIWFVQDWGIASVLRYLREDTDVKRAESKISLDDFVEARPVESPVDSSPRADQRVDHATVKPWPEERMAEPVKATEPDARYLYGPPVAHVRTSARQRARRPAVVTGPKGRARSVPARRWTPRSYFGWFVLVLASIAVIVALVVWFVAMAA